MHICKGCRHETYGHGIPDWISCGHPTTQKKTPKFERGDPAFVDHMTGDLRVSEAGDITECATFQACD